jgi:hypothetical protein
MMKLIRDFDKFNRTDCIDSKGGRTAVMPGNTFYTEMRPRASGVGYGRSRAFTRKAADAMVARGEAEIVEWSALRGSEAQ